MVSECRIYLARRQDLSNQHRTHRLRMDGFRSLILQENWILTPATSFTSGKDVVIRKSEKE